uniref:Uncharacterized protein n=1 Tax=Peronospora matthiolae TaxID=2874970 RepID=A0AAV1UYC3_9STRA
MLGSHSQHGSRDQGYHSHDTSEEGGSQSEIPGIERMADQDYLDKLNLQARDASVSAMVVLFPGETEAEFDAVFAGLTELIIY